MKTKRPKFDPFNMVKEDHAELEVVKRIRAKYPKMRAWEVARLAGAAMRRLKDKKLSKEER